MDGINGRLLFVLVCLMEMSNGDVADEKDLNLQKHKLGRRWTLWFDNPANKQRADNFGETLRAIYTFETVEDFWCIQHNVAPPGSLKPNCDIHLFKEGVVPKWEDPRCEKGGRWTVSLPKVSGEESTNEIWLSALLSCIGDMFEEIDEICGVACNIRAKGNRVCLWTSNSSNKELQLSIGRQFKHLLGLQATEKISYLAHADAKKMATSSKIGDLYAV